MDKVLRFANVIVLAIVALALAFISYNVMTNNDAVVVNTQGVGQYGSARFYGTVNVTGAVDLDSTLNVDGASTLASLDVAGAFTSGSGNLSMVGYATADKELVCGVTGVFTASAAVDLSGSLSAIDYAVVSQITAPAATGALLHYTAPTTTTLEVISLEADYTAGTTGVNVGYCVIGDQ